VLTRPELPAARAYTRAREALVRAAAVLRHSEDNA
jgi:hypothetical protein